MTSWASAVAGVSFNLSFTSSSPIKRPRPLQDVAQFGLVISDTSCTPLPAFWKCVFYFLHRKSFFKNMFWIMTMYTKWINILAWQGVLHTLVFWITAPNTYCHILYMCVFAYLISPTSGCFSFCFSSRLVRYRPTRSALPWRSSFMITSSTARPMAHDTGLPPNWEI